MHSSGERATRSPIGAALALRHLEAWAPHRQALAAVALIAALGAALRLQSLGRISGFVFDEAYYVRDAASLGTNGFERALQLDAGKVVPTDPHTWYLEPLVAASVAHPPGGKWLIVAGMLGAESDPFRWRLAVALLGVALIALTGAAAWLVTRSVAGAAISAGAMAIDGQAIVLSRTAILDGPLTALVMTGVVLALLDLHWSARRRERATSRLMPLLALRPYALASAAAFGLAMSVKWSAAPILIAVMLVTWSIDAIARLRRDGRGALADIGLRGVLGGLAEVAVAVSAYLITWTGWLSSPGAFGRSWAHDTGGFGGLLGLLPDSLQSLLHYHSQILSSDIGISSPHASASPAWQWPFLMRPTLFYRADGDFSGALCRTSCTQMVLDLPNPVLWYAGVAAAIVAVVLWILALRRGRRGGPAAIVLVAGLGAWVPWLLLPQRTIFQFYSILLAPMLMVALAAVLAGVLRRGRAARVAVALFGIAALAIAVVFAPIVWGVPVPASWVDALRWLPGWP
ncbi:MAG: phospholipid carrier-dependent glycosyltransferase [Actinobacteria bacterium]|nr:phospholipid carrier-dependent glycosyltransferase [Actinomycetota bacterium]